MRKIAIAIAESPSRKTLLQVADDYEQMARTLDVIADTDRDRNARISSQTLSPKAY